MEMKRVPQMQVRSHVRSGAGGYINGVWYPDMSGVCGGVIPPTPLPDPPNPGGGYIGGVWYSDKSGTCG